jgi:hypothetical protein
LRPWKTREAFQTMPQATKPTAFSASNQRVAEFRAADGPDRHRGGAEQIGVPTISDAGMSPACRRTRAWPSSMPCDHRRERYSVEVSNDMGSPERVMQLIRRTSKMQVSRHASRTLGAPCSKSVCTGNKFSRKTVVSHHNGNQKGADRRFSSMNAAIATNFS